MFFFLLFQTFLNIMSIKRTIKKFFLKLFRKKRLKPTNIFISDGEFKTRWDIEKQSRERETDEFNFDFTEERNKIYDKLHGKFES